jgi:hypothetical protein
MWERHDQAVQVALYVLAVLAAASPFATAADRGAALRYMDDLGLSNGGRAKNRWVIDDAGHASEPRRDGPPPEQPGSRRAAKDRLLELVVNQ